MNDRERLVAFLDGCGWPYDLTEFRNQPLPDDTDMAYRDAHGIKYVRYADVIDTGFFRATFDEAGRFRCAQRSLPKETADE